MLNKDKPKFLTPPELSERWKISGRTLEGWRYHGKGPRHVNLGGRVRYPLEEVERFESTYNIAEWQ